MAMTAGNIIKATDIPDAIRAKVNAYLANYPGSSQVSFGGSADKVITSINTVCQNAKQNSGSFIDYIISNRTAYKSQKMNTGDVIRPEIALHCIYKAMREACRCGTIKYQTYSTTAYMNSPGYRPSSVNHSVKGIFATPHVSVADFYKKATGNNASNIKNQAAALVGTPIKALDLAALMDRCIAACKELETTTSRGHIDSCYNSCHSNCHGSSRSRR